MLRSMFSMLFCCAMVSVSTAATPSFTVLGDLPGGGDSSYVNGVSANGKTVVGTSEGDAGNLPFVWKVETGMIVIPGSASSSSSGTATAVSADGRYTTGMRDGSVSRPFRWDADDASLEELNSYGDSYGISDDGALIGGSLYSRSGEQGFYWTADANINVLPRFSPSDSGSSVRGVSGDGNFLVGSVSVGALRPAMRWSMSAGYRLLAGPDGELPSAQALAASFDGEVIVGALADGSAFRWTAETGIQPILEEATNEAVNAAARDVSADGSVVVGGSLETTAFIWSAARGARPLRDVLIEFGLTDQLGDFRPLMATGISADGRTIVGVGTIDGVSRGFVATVPEPSSIGLLVLGIGAIVVARGRAWLSRE
jgi:uncharacterized membrane protein